MTVRDLEAIIREELQIAAVDAGVTLAEQIARTTTVVDTGLDSLGFAILVARLEERLGFDPFVVMAEPVYPTTFGEFVEIYERHVS